MKIICIKAMYISLFIFIFEIKKKHANERKQLQKVCATDKVICENQIKKRKIHKKKGKSVFFCFSFISLFIEKKEKERKSF